MVFDNRTFLSWLLEPAHGFILYTNLDLVNEMLMPLHTAIICVIGIDKMYLIHLLFMMLPTFLWQANECIVTVFENLDAGFYLKFTIWQVVLARDLLTGIGMIIVLMMYYIFSVQTRILYVQMYRNVVSNITRAPMNEIIIRIKGPWLSIFTFLMLVFMWKVFMITLSKKTMILFESPYVYVIDFSYFLSEALVVIFQLWMYLILDINKRNYLYFMLSKSTSLEKCIIVIICLWLLVCVSATVACIVRAFNLDEFKGKKLQMAIGIWNLGLVIFRIIAKSSTNIFFWYYALEEWKVNSLSVGELEYQLQRFYDPLSSTFIGGSRKVRLKD